MARMHDMRAGDFMEKEGGEFGEGTSPVERLGRLANRLSEAGTAWKKVADAAKPLYDSLNEQQKRVFVFLSREMLRMRHHGMEMGMGMGPGDDHHWHTKRKADRTKKTRPARRRGTRAALRRRYTLGRRYLKCISRKRPARLSRPLRNRSLPRLTCLFLPFDQSTQSAHTRHLTIRINGEHHPCRTDPLLLL